MCLKAAKSTDFIGLEVTTDAIKMVTKGGMLIGYVDET